MSLNAIDIFPWDSNFNTGLPGVDEQHKKLVQMLNRLASNIAYGANAELLHQIFDEMAEYALYHFETEEVIWRKYLADDPEEITHRAIHRSFVQEVVRLKSSLASCALAEVAEETLGYLARWLASHILESDRLLAYTVRARKEGLPLEAAKLRAKDEMGGATRALIDIILSIYSTLSSNTLRLMRELAEHRHDKEELILAREGLEESEVNFRSFFDTIDDFLFVLDGNGAIVRVNRAVVERLGYPEATLVGRSIVAVHPKEHHEEALRIVGQMPTDGGDYCQVSLKTADGRLIPVETRVVAGQWNGAPAVFGVSRDISEQLCIRRRLEEESEHSHRLLEEASEREFFWRQSQQIGQLGGWRADPLNNTVMWTQGVYEIIEMPMDYRPDLETALDVYLPDSRIEVADSLKRCLATGVPFSIQVQVRCAQSGVAKWAELRGQPHRNESGAIDYLMGTLQDISEQKQAEKTLVDSLTFNKSLIETMIDGVAVCHDLLGPPFVEFTVWNPAMEKLTGYSLADINRLGWYQTVYVDPEVQEKAKARMERMRQGDNLDHEEWTITRKDGEKRTVEITTTVISLTESSTHVMAVMHDVTESRAAKEALRFSEKRFDLAMRAAHDGLWDWDIRSHATYFSPRWKSMLGYADGELDSSFAVWEQLTDDEGRARTMALIDKCISGQSEEFSTEFRMRHKEGRWVDILSRAILIRDDDGTPVRMVGTHVDISQQKHAAQVLINHNQYLEEAVQQRTASLEKHRTALQNNQTALTSLLQSTTLTQSPLPEVLAHITEIFAGHLGVARVSIWQRTLDGNAIACVDLYEAAKGQHCAGMNLHRQDYIAYFDALDRNIVIDAVNAHTHAATAKFSSTYLTPLGISSMLDVPIFAHGRNWGVICCEHVGQIRTWTAEEIAFAIAVVALVALAVETEEHRATMLAFEKAKDAAEAANRAKSAFLANMSHELRTPMHGVMGMIALATRRVVDPKVLEQLHKAKLAAERLGGVLDDILDLSKIEADRLELEERPLQLAETIDQIRATLNNKAEEKGLRLAVDIPSLLANVHLVGDALRLGQILMNLVGNAIKFTDRGEVTVRVHPVGETAEALQVRFEVIDSGIGIDPEVQRRLFQSFEQADNSMTRKYGGTGLGLAICKRLVRMMGGEIGMQSVQGLGSTFWFVVRLKKQEHRTATPARTVANVSAEQCLKSTYAGMRSLLVEDEPINQEVARELLEYVCLEVDLAEDGQQALELAKRRSYAVILMDMQMPVMNGIDATKEIRAHSLNRETPIIAITANASEADRAVCLAAGMNEHIAKPMDPKQLYEILLTLLERHRGLSMKSGHSPDG